MTLEYLGGFFDGEGSISIIFSKPRLKPYKNKVKNPGRGNFDLLVCVTNTKKEILEVYLEKFGGNLRLDSKHKATWKPYWKDCYTWSVGNIKGLSFLKTIYPFLFIKKEQARLAIEFQESLRKPQTSGSRSLTDEEWLKRSKMREAMLKLNGRAVNPLGKQIQVHQLKTL